MQFSQQIMLWTIRLKFKWLSITNKRKAAEKAFELFCTPLSPRPRHEPSLFKQADKKSIPFNGLQVRLYEWNRSGTQTVLILHGFNSSAYKFHRYAQLLIQKNYRVLAVDAPAHGRSDGKTVNALEYSQLIKQVQANHGPINGYIAHSFGGIAVALALEDIPHTSAEKLVLIAPATETTSAVQAAFGLLHLRDATVQRYFNEYIESKSGHPVEWFSIKRALQHIEAQVLWCHDEIDNVTPISDVQSLIQQPPPGLEFYITRGLGHRKIYHDSGVKNKIAEFL